MTGMPPNTFMVRFYRLGLGVLVGKMILLLTTSGRRSGLPRTTPLQYEKEGDSFVVVSSKGSRADWVRNLKADPNVGVEVRRQKIRCKAELVEDPETICNFLELRLEKHPLMIGAILRSEGLPSKPGRDALLAYSCKLVMVILHPN